VPDHTAQALLRRLTRWLDREAAYEGMFGPPAEGGQRRLPLSEGALQVIVEWKLGTRPGSIEFGFAMRSGKGISPTNVLRRWIFAAYTHGSFRFWRSSRAAPTLRSR